MNYRKDIQILRGISVLFVVLYHLEVPVIKSGFLGVDVFFVISGFLMANLFNPNDKAGFFQRRAKRLLPAYYATIALTMLASIFILLPVELNQVITQSVYGLFFTSNIGFWLQNSYFDKTAFNPLLHLWSLGVEIQYYCILPWLYVVFLKSRVIFYFLMFMSAVTCFYVVGISPKTAFFMMPMRVWEFFIGFFVAKFLTQNGESIFKSFTLLGGLALIILLFIPTLNINGESLGFITSQPGLSALGITIATGLVLAFGLPEFFLAWKLSGFLERLGKYSYSIYLAHFPVIVLFLYTPFAGTQLQTKSMPELITLVSIISAFSLALYYLIENPGRKNRVLSKANSLFDQNSSVTLSDVNHFGDGASGVISQTSRDIKLTKKFIIMPMGVASIIGLGYLSPIFLYTNKELNLYVSPMNFR